jgi:diguanylate cyclase (GGDEF)-like protein
LAALSLSRQTRARRHLPGKLRGALNKNPRGADFPRVTASTQVAVPITEPRTGTPAEQVQPRPRAQPVASPYTWLCPTELDRERLISTVGLVGRARAMMFLVLAGVVLTSAPELGWWPVIPLGVAALGSSYMYRNLDTRRVPEYWAAAGWLLTQTMLAAGIAVTGGPQSPALPWLAIAIVSLVARFSRNGVLAGMGFLMGLLVLLTLGMQPSSVIAHPHSILIPAGLLFSVWVFSEALMRSDLDQRGRDKITGLANQPKFAEHLRIALARRNRPDCVVSVLAIDLDGFRVASDDLGPSAGNELLRQAGARIAVSTRSADLIARRSGEGFLVLLSDLHDEYQLPHSDTWQLPEPAARNVGRSIQAAFTEPLRVGDSEVYLGACIGIAMQSNTELVADPAATAENLLSHAQQALSGAQSSGPGTLMVYDPARPGSHSRLRLITRLRQAIDRDEFVLYYQPTIDLHTGRIAGVEALLRWQDPTRGLVAPGEFIEVAEETGLIEPLGAWVLDEVCRQTQVWEQQGLSFDVAFNLSPRQLWQPEMLPKMVASVLAAGVRPQRLIVEITESSALREPERTTQLLEQITHEGLRLAIDDFGVGLSSLNRLQTIPADVLKIDRSFVWAIDSSPTGAAMVRTIIQLAHNFGMRSHAEGVETEAQRRFLVANGCELAQGFLFSKPRPAKEITALYLGSQVASGVPLAVLATA